MRDRLKDFVLDAVICLLLLPRKVVLVIALLIVIALGYFMHTFRVGYDDTDNTVAGERSGMRLYTDHATGCQYLAPGVFGGLSPRLDSTGKQICHKP